MPVDQLLTISKFLSYVLRHRPEEIGIKLDYNGWVDIDTLLEAIAEHGRHKITREQLLEVVRTNDKQRFAISGDGKRIRANQGHSVEVDLDYEEMAPPAVLYHGTADHFIDSIREKGLQKGQRHHVHLTQSIAIASAVGQRYGRLSLLKIDAEKMHADGFAFFVSDNGVWLTDHVPPQYIDFNIAP